MAPLCRAARDGSFHLTYINGAAAIRASEFGDLRQLSAAVDRGGPHAALADPQSQWLLGEHVSA
jgi:hypothetical protein